MFEWTGVETKFESLDDKEKTLLRMLSKKEGAEPLISESIKLDVMVLHRFISAKLQTEDMLRQILNTTSNLFNTKDFDVPEEFKTNFRDAVGKLRKSDQYSNNVLFNYYRSAECPFTKTSKESCLNYVGEYLTNVNDIPHIIKPSVTPNHALYFNNNNITLRENIARVRNVVNKKVKTPEKSDVAIDPLKVILTPTIE